MNRRKVVIYNNSFFALSETFVYQQVRFVKEEFDISLLGHLTANNDHYPIEDIPFTCLDQQDSLMHKAVNKVKRSVGIPVAMGPANSKMAYDFLAKEKPDLVHVHFGFNAVKILPVVKSLGIPLIVTFHGYDASKMILSKPSYYNALPGLLNYCTRIIVVSQHMLDYLPLSDADREKVVVYPCAVDDQFFAPIDRKSKPGQIGLLHSGRIVAKKGVPDLVKVFHSLQQQHPQVRLDIIGEGPDARHTKDVINQLHLGDRIIMHGSQPQTVVRDFIAESDIFILNSRIADDGDMEGSPVSILEAMSMGKAVISTRHAGIPSIIEDGKNGLLVNERDNDALCHAIIKLIEEPRLRYKLGQNARQTVEEKFSFRVKRHELLSIYDSAVRQHPSIFPAQVLTTTPLESKIVS